MDGSLERMHTYGFIFHLFSVVVQRLGGVNAVCEALSLLLCGTLVLNVTTNVYHLGVWRGHHRKIDLLVYRLCSRSSKWHRCLAHVVVTPADL